MARIAPPDRRPSRGVECDFGNNSNAQTANIGLWTKSSPQHFSNAKKRHPGVIDR
ncbi:MAG: hypothetical protein NVV73_13055 [Cellvibrionaceae bacterium]|nr:hypothetical protein [Cellvibrionaceae bacterium]